MSSDLRLSIGDIDMDAFHYSELCSEYLRSVVDMIGIGIVGLYGADNRRSELHREILDITGIDPIIFQDISNNLDKYCYLELTPNYYNGYGLGNESILLADCIVRINKGRKLIRSGLVLYEDKNK